MKVKVLIADDEQEFSQTLAQRLELRGFAVTDVYSGQSALDVLEKIDIDVALLDVQMPEISGIDVLKIIKENKPLIQVIMLTGAGTIKIAIEGMKLGAYDFCSNLLKSMCWRKRSTKPMLSGNGMWSGSGRLK